MQTVAAFLCCAALLGVAHSQVDLTLVPEANGTVVVQACLAKITGANIFAADNQMLRRIAYVETRDGTDSDTYTPTNNGGIWQLSESKYMQTKGSSSVLTAPVSSISSSFGITWSTTQWVDLRKPLYSALAARLYLLLISTSIPLATNINGQASYWVNQYTFSAGTTSDFTTAVTALQAIEECSVNGLDLFFVLDESGSVGYSNYQLMKTFAYNIANSFTIGPDDVQIGLLSYSSGHSFRFYLNTHSTKSAVLTAINNIPYNSGGTYTAGALNALRLNGFTSSVGARPSSQGIPRVAIVVTDGYSNSFSQTVAAANALHTAGIIGFAIGISGANTAELNAIASEPSYVAFISSFNSALLANLQQTISNEACTASPEFEVTEMVSSMVGQGQSQYVQYNVPPGNMGITIQLNVSNNGTAVLYASNVVQTPNEALHDIKIVTSGYGDAFVNISALNPLGSQDKVFVAIEGVSGNSTIQVSAEVGDTSTEPVMVTPLASDIARNFGQSLVVSCNVTGKPSPQVNWYKDGVMLTSSSSVQIQTMNINGNNLTKLSTLTISSVADIHEGMYTCTGTNMLPNGAVTHSSSFTLDVTGYVSINFVGQVHTFSSISLDWDLPPVTGLAAQVDHYLVNIDELETSKNWTFFAVQSHATILSLHPYFTYICRVAIVTNLTHPYTSTISLRTLQEPPTGPPLNPNSSATTSQTVNMTWSPPALEHQNGIIQYYLVNVTEIETGTLTAYNITSAWLFLTGLHPHYNYLFVFAAATIGLGPTGSSITITTTEDAPTAAPLSLSVSIVNPTTVSVSWNPPPLEFRNGIIRNYTIRYYESQTNTFYTAISQNTPAVISSLHAYYNYSFSVAAFTVLTGPFSSSVNLQTPQTVPQGSPGNFTANVSSPYSAVLSWDPLPSDQQNGVVTGYVINVTVIETGQTFLLFSATTSLTVNSLNPFRTFVCIIAAQTSAGIGPFGPIFTVVTPQDAPAAAPATTTSSGVSSRSFAINWSPPLYKFQNGVITHYVIRVTEIETGTVTQYMSTSTSYSLQSLHPAYTYQYEIAASTSVGLGPFSSPISIITDEEIPGGPPAAINGVSSKPTALTLVWTPPPPSDRNGIIVSYLINVTLLTTGEVVQYTSTNTSIVINGLKPFTTYTCIIAASTAVGLGPFTQVFTITTDEDSPNTAPVITTSFSVDSSTVALQWTPPPVEDHNGIIRKYLINATAIQTGEYTITETTTTTGIVVSLVPSFTYLFSVSAYTVSAGPYTPTITITLPEDVPSGFPRDLAGSSTTPYSIYLSWNPPPLNEQSGQIIEYIINVTHAGTLNTVQYTATTTNINITNLEPYTTYICVVAAGTAIGTGPFSHLFFLRTLEAVPSASPEHATGVSGGPNTIHVAWDPPSIDEQNGEIDGYRINVTEAETNNVFQLITNQTQITINNLHPFYTYHCYITAITVGEGPYTDAVTIVTDEAAPSAPPQSVTISVQSSTGVFIQWSPPQTSDTNGIIRSYTVILVNTRTGTVASYSATNTNINITNLSPYTEYRYNVSAVTISEGPFSLSLNFTTFQDVPSSPPENVNVLALSTSTLQLVWDPPSISSVNGIVQHYIITVYELATDTIFQSTTSTSTQLSVSGLHPYYIYTCSISAVTIGSGPVMNITIQMPEDVPASAPVNIESSTVTSTMVEISWDPLPSEDENGIVRHYLINVTEIQTGNTFQTTSSDESTMLSNLHPAYEYTFRIAAYTIGSGSYSTVFTITTLEDVPSSAPIGLSSTVQGSTSVLLSWSPPPAADQNGVITVYTVEVINTVTSNKDVYMTSSSTLTVVSLDPYTTYECIVAANTSVGMGPFSAKLAFQTVEAVPTAPPEDVSVEAPSSTSLDVEWSAPPQDSQNGIIRSYIVRVYEVITSTTLTYNTTEESLTVGFLHPHYQYQVSVAAVTVGQGPFSDATTIQTPQDAPSGPPTAINVSSLSSTSLFISWSPPLPAQSNGVIQYYIVNVSVAESQEKLQFETSSTTLTLNDLQPFYSHTVIVAAVTVAPGPFSNEYNLALPSDAPSGPPQSISGSVISSTSVQLSWSPPLSVHQNGLIQSYTILVFEQQTNTTVEEHQDFQENMIIITSLHPHYDYTLSVAAHTVTLGPYGSVTLMTSQDAPSGPPQNVSTIITSSRSVTVQWNPPQPDLQNGVIQHYLVQIVVAQTSEVLQYSATGQSLTIINLHPYYVYTCTVTAVTVASGPAALVTFQLPQDVPTGPPLNISVIPLNSTSLYVTWKPPQGELQNGIITSYSVQLFEVETSTTQIINYVTGLSVVVNNLRSNYMYQVQVAAVTTGLGPYSVTVKSQLPEDRPSGSPTGVSGASTSPYSITIAWTAPEPGLLNGAVTGYIINVTHSDTLVTVQYNSITTSLVISDLEAYTTYICVVAAETAAGNGPFSHLILVQTQETAPSGAPEHASGIPVGSTSIHLTWDPPSAQYQNGLIREYLVNISEPVSGYINQTSTDQTQITIKSLLPHRTYTCYVAAVTVAVGPYTGAIMVATGNDVPGGSPLNVTSTINSSTSVTLQWSPPQADLQNGVIQFYTLQLTAEQTGSEIKYTSVGLSLTITDLHPYYNYTCTIAAVTVAPGPAETITFQMPEDVPSGFPENVTANAVNATAFFVYWLPPHLHNQNGIIREYKIEVVDSKSGNVSYFTVQNMLQITVNSLHPYYNYHIRVAAVTVGIGPYSIEVTTQLLEAAPSESPSNFFAGSSVATQPTLQWSPISEDQQNGKLNGYQVTCNSESAHTVTVQVSDTSTSVTLADLQADSIYTCFVCGFTSAGCGPMATTYISTYASSPVGPPTAVIMNTTTTSIDVQWEPPFDPEDLIDSYSITYQLINTSFSFSVPRPPVTITDIDGTSFTLQPLLESSVYRIVVNAVADNTTSPGSDPIVVPTAEPDLLSPDNFKCLPISYSELSCSWEHPRLTEEYVVSGYTIQYKLAEGYDYYPEYGHVIKTPLQPNAQQYNISSLQPSGGYLVILTAELNTEVGSGGSGIFLQPAESPSVPSIIVQTSTVNTTLADTPTGIVRNLTVNLTSSTSLLLSWVPPERHLWRGTINHYLATATRLGPARGPSKRQVPFSTVAVVQPAANHPDPSLAVDSLMQEHYQLQGLEEYFQYSITVSVVNDAGTGPQHPPILQYMPEAAPSGPPIEIDATATSSALTITWSPPSPLEANGFITGFTLELTRIQFGGRTETHSLSGSTLGFRKDGLAAYEPVLVRITASTEHGQGPFSNNITFITLEASPSAPQSVSAQLVSDGSILVHWREPKFANGLLRGYQVIYTIHGAGSNQDDQREKQNQFAISTNVDVNNITLLNAEPGIYEFKVRARSGAGYGLNSSSAVVVINEQLVTPPATDRIETSFIPSIVIPVVLVLAVVLFFIIVTVITVGYKRHQSNKRYREDALVIELQSTRGLDSDAYDVANPAFVIENEYDEVNFGTQPSAAASLSHSRPRAESDDSLRRLKQQNNIELKEEDEQEEEEGIITQL